MSNSACYAKVAAGLGGAGLAAYMAKDEAAKVVDNLMAGVQAGLDLLPPIFGSDEAAPVPPQAVTVGHNIKHKAFWAALIGAIAGAIIAVAAIAVMTVAIVATGGAAIALMGVGIAALIGSSFVASALTNFIDKSRPATDGPVLTGSSNVFIHGKPAARAGVDKVGCVKHPPSLIAQGSETVAINDSPAVRIGDKTACDGVLEEGVSNVFVGSGQGTVPGIEIVPDEFPFWQKAILFGVEYLIPPTGLLVKGGIRGGIKALGKFISKHGVMKSIAAGAKALGRAAIKQVKNIGNAIKGALLGACALFGKLKSKMASWGKSISNFIKKVKCRLGNPIDPISGFNMKNFTDFELGQTIPLKFERSYSSGDKDRGILGIGWRDSFSDYLEIKAQKSQITWYSSCGQIIVFDLPQGYKKVFNRHFPHLLLTQHNKGYTLEDTDTHLVHYFRYEKSMNKAYRVATEDYNGNSIRYYLNEHFQPKEIEHSDGIRLELEYQHRQLHKIRRVDTSHHNNELAEYQQKSNYLTYAWSLGNTHQQIQYNAQGLMERITYHEKSQVNYHYDVNERCIETKGSEGYHHWRFQYDRENRVTKAYDANGKCWQIHFDEDLQATQEIDPKGNKTQFSYDSYGLVAEETNPIGDKTTHEYESWTGKPTTVTDTLGRTTAFIYDDYYENIQSIESSSGTTYFQYDASQNIKQVTLPTGNNIHYEHDTHGNLSQVKIADSLSQQYSYDKNNHLTKAADWLQQEQQYQYTEHDQLSRVITPRQHAWEYQYDSESRLSQIRDPLSYTEQLNYTQGHQPSLFAGGNKHKQQIEYGVFDLPIKQTDAEGNITTFEYDKVHQFISKVTNAKGEQWCFDYDSVGNLIKESDYNGFSTEYTYTPLGQLASKETPMGDTIRYFYDAAGRLTQKHTKEGASVYDWDDQDRLTKLETPDSTLEYQYNDKGQLSQESQNNHIIRYEYDELGNRKARHIQASPWHPESDTQSTFYRYDANGQLIQITLPEQQPLDLEYDADGNLTQQQTPAGYINHQKIDPKGRIERQVIGKDEKIEHADSLPKYEDEPQYAFVNREYDYDAADNLLSCHAPGNTTHWAYNKNNQQQSRHNTQNYQYTSQLAVQGFTKQGHQEGQQAYHYGKAGQLTQKQTSESHSKHYEYDDNGRLTKKIIERNGFRSTQQTYHWNSEDQLKKVITKNGHHWHYQYDGFGRRILKHNSNTNETTHILWDGNTIAQEICISPKHGNKDQEEQMLSITHWYFIPNSFTPLAQQTQHNTDKKHQAKGELYTNYIATDHMGTVKELFSPQGDLVWRNNNSLWGKPDGELDNPNRTPEIDCSLGFQGQYFDKETGLHYNYHRYYDADMGQYISQDPIGLLGGLHPQAYVHNPNGWVDPWGLNVVTGAGRDYVTYRGIKGGKPYTGIASAPSSLGLDTDQIISRRYNGNFNDYGGRAPQSVYEGSGIEGKRTARGLEQHFYEEDLTNAGGDKSKVANKQNPVGENNRMKDKYIKAKNKWLGKNKCK